MKSLCYRERERERERESRLGSLNRGFTIVELLIVIVVIAILATIVIVAYTGITQRATVASMTSDLGNSSKQLKLYQVDNSAYPVGIDCSATPAANTICLKSSGSTSYTTFTPNNTTNPQTFCLTATNGTNNYFINQDGTPTNGGCSITNLIANPSFEVDTTGWSAAGGALLASSTDFAFSGTHSVKVTPSSSTYSGIAFSAPGIIGNQYTYSAYVYSTSSQSINFAADNMGIATGLTVGPAWQRITLSGTQTGNFPLYVRSVNASAPIFYVDGVMFTQGATTYNYADGSSPGWIWNGIVNESTSIGPPL